MQAQALRHNAFDFILAPEAAVLPIDHAHDALCTQACPERIERDAAVTACAAELGLAVERDTLGFLDSLNRQRFAGSTQTHRDAGAPHSSSFTLQSRRGAYRDLALLLVDCCRAEGIAARFASGYQRGHQRSQRRHAHAWREVAPQGTDK